MHRVAALPFQDLKHWPGVFLQGKSPSHIWKDSLLLYPLKVMLKYDLHRFPKSAFADTSPLL